MLLLIVLAILAIILFSVGFVVHWLFIIAAIVAIIWLISLFTVGCGGGGARRWWAARAFRMSRAAHCGPPVPVPPCGGVPDRNPPLDPRPHGVGDPASEVDLVGALGLPQLLREAQGLLLRRDPQLGHVPLTR